MALFDTSCNSYAYDESCLLTARIIDVKNKGSYSEYTISVSRSFAVESKWDVVYRYRDLAELYCQLVKYGLDLEFPPKKWIGNMDPDFVQQRTLALQAFIDSILGNFNIAWCPVVQRFFCKNLNPLLDVQNRTPLISMSLRSLIGWKFMEPWPNIGWRLSKSYGIVSKVADPKAKAMLCWSLYGTDRKLDLDGIKEIIQFYTKIKHPFILPVVAYSVNIEGTMTIRRFSESGSLRDLLTKKKPKLHFVAKYAASCTEDIELSLDDYRLIGRQILEALVFLHKRCLPYGALHAGNVFIASDGTCQLSGLENCVIGLPSMYRSYAVQCKAIKTLADLDIYCFGHLLAEMCGFRLNAPFADSRAFTLLGPYIGSILSTLLSEDATSTKMPTAQDLIRHEFFAVRMMSIPLDKVPTRLKHLFEEIHSAVVDRLLTDRKQHFQNQQLQKVETFLNSSREREKRKESSKAWVDQMQSVCRSEAIAKQTLLNTNLYVDIPVCLSGEDLSQSSEDIAASNNSSDNHICDNGISVIQPLSQTNSQSLTPLTPLPSTSLSPLPSCSSDDTLSRPPEICAPVSGARDVLLSSIRSFSPSKLKKTQTVDKSRLKH